MTAAFLAVGEAVWLADDDLTSVDDLAAAADDVAVVAAAAAMAAWTVSLNEPVMPVRENLAE